MERSVKHSFFFVIVFYRPEGVCELEENGADIIFASVSGIKSRLSEELSVGGLAGLAFTSKTHYQRLFKSVVGEPVMEYVRQRRMELACRNLRETGDSVITVALNCGYSSHEGFARAFKERFGVSPTQYRKRQAIMDGENNSICGGSIGISDKITHDTIRSAAVGVADGLAEMAAKISRIVADASPMLKAAGQNALGLDISFREWETFAEKINSAQNETRKFYRGETDLLELFDKTADVMKVLDDVNFQTALLLFLTSVEWLRMGKVQGSPFSPVIESLGALRETVKANNGGAASLIGEIKIKIRSEIKREALLCLEKISGTLGEAAKEGALLAERMRANASALEPRGRGFSLIAEETDGIAGEFGLASDAFKKLAGYFNETENAEGTIGSEAFYLTSRLEESVLRMNVASFNNLVESARAGECGECPAISRAALDYAGKLSSIAHGECVESIGTFVKLAAFLGKKESSPEINYERNFSEDTALQAGFLVSQLRLESERAANERFLSISREIGAASEVFRDAAGRTGKRKRDDAAKIFCGSLTGLIGRGREAAREAGPRGACFAYILESLETVWDALAKK